MQNYCKTIGALAAASALVAGNAKAEVEYEIHTGYTSEYIFRGLDLGNDLVEAGVDVAGEWNSVGLSAGIWGATFNDTGATNLKTAPVTNQVDQEVDIYAEAAYDWGFMTSAVGYIYYWNVGKLGRDAQELYFSFGKDWGWAQSSLTYFWGLDGQTDMGGYTQLAFSRGFELNPCLTLQVGTSFGYLFEHRKLADWTTKVALDWGFTETATLSPFIALSVPMDNGNTTYLSGQGDEFYGGAMLSVSF